jgi:hypothetical protein
MLSTVDEMHLFYRALFESDKLLKPDTRKLRFNVDEPMGSGGMEGATYFVYERDGAGTPAGAREVARTHRYGGTGFLVPLHFYRSEIILVPVEAQRGKP